jgi:F0F1-type ATP synthase delta subunit
MGIVLTVLIVQCIIAAVVIFVLKHLLDRELMDAAMEKLQASDFFPAGAVTITSASSLDAQTQSRIQALLRRKGDVKIVFAKDPGIQGGLIIACADKTIDFSVANRLKNIFS